MLAPLELQTLDWRFRLRGAEAPSGEVVLVVADDAAVAELGAWPPPRTALAAAIDRLAAAGAGLIVVNLLLTQSQEDLPPATRELLAASLAALTPEAMALRARLTAALAESGPDAMLAAAIERAPPVLLPFAFVQDLGRPTLSRRRAGSRASAYRLHTSEAGTSAVAAYQPHGLILPAAKLGEAAAAMGHVSLLLEKDGYLRADLPAVAYRRRGVPVVGCRGCAPATRRRARANGGGRPALASGSARMSCLSMHMAGS